MLVISVVKFDVQFGFGLYAYSHRSFDCGEEVYYNRRGHRKSGENPSR